MDYLYTIGGLLLLLAGGDYLVNGAVDIANRLKISPLIVGMTIVAFGTSAPELIVSLEAAITGHPEISLGNVIGSNIANIGLILGLTALILPLAVQKVSFTRDMPFLIMISVMLFAVMKDGLVSRYEGIIDVYKRQGVQYQFARGNVQKGQVRALIFDLTSSTEQIETELEKCTKLSYTMHSLQIPLRIGYEYTFDNDLGLFAYAGPILNFALDWYLRGETADGITATLHQISGVFVGKNGDNQTTKRDNDYRHYNVFDLGLGAAVGVSYKWVYFSAGCDVGLLNICSHPSYTLNLLNTRYDIDNSARNIQLKLALGFRF